MIRAPARMVPVRLPATLELPPRHSGVAAAAVCHNDAGCDGTRDAPHHLRDRLLLVERRYHDDGVTRSGVAPSTIPASRIHRSKAPAQAAARTAGGRPVR